MATVRERAKRDGTSTFQVLFRHGTKQKSLTFRDRKSAEAFRRLVDALGPERALMEQQTHDGITLDELAERFFTWKSSRVRSDRTVADYRRDYANWIAPTLGHRSANAITEHDVQGLVDSMAERLSPKSVSDRHAILHGIFKFGVAPSRHLIDDNPCVGTELPKRFKAPPKGLRPAEWAALYAALRQINGDAADLAFFLLSTGWRWSEATALSMFDVEDDGATMHVTMGRVLRRNAAGQSVLVEDEGKSEMSMRRTSLDLAAAAVVRSRVRVGARPGDLVFTTATGAAWNHGHFRYRAWEPAVRAAGLTRHPTPHWLRHTHVAWNVLGGKADLSEIQKRIGHEDIRTTINVYGRMLSDISPEALDAFAAIRDSAVPLRALDD